MTQILSFIFETFFFPPGLFITLLLLSLLINKVRYLKLFIVFQIVLLYLLSIPLSSHFLFAQLESIAPLTEAHIKNHDADVIVVLAGGINRYAREYRGPDISGYTIPRLRYAAWLQKKTGLPLIVTGGVERGGATEAELMQQVLRQEYGVQVPIQVEKQSRNTYENALYSSRILNRHQYKKYFLVTSAFHMPRAVDVFTQFNKNVIPAGTGYLYNDSAMELDILKPNSKSLRQNYLALHEFIGRIWYRLRYSSFFKGEG